MLQESVGNYSELDWNTEPFWKVSFTGDANYVNLEEVALLCLIELS
jgi:hypothetical protein